MIGMKLLLRALGVDSERPSHLTCQQWRRLVGHWKAVFLPSCVPSQILGSFHDFHRWHNHISLCIRQKWNPEISPHCYQSKKCPCWFFLQWIPLPSHNSDNPWPGIFCTAICCYLHTKNCFDLQRCDLIMLLKLQFLKERRDSPIGRWDMICVTYF